MTDDAMEVLDDEDDDEAADEELDRVFAELNLASTGGMASAPTGLQQGAHATPSRGSLDARRAQHQGVLGMG